MRKWLNKYFVMSRAEFNGLVILWLLIVVVTLVPALFSWLFPEKLIPMDRRIVEQLKARNTYSKIWKNHESDKRITIKGELFSFDPNTLSIEGWQRLGLSKKQSMAIVHYRDKGGKFRIAEDVKKIYTITPSFFTRIAPFIQIKSSVVTPGESFTSLRSKELIVLEINAADTLSLLEVNGIGPAFARRIVKYRERLGGFYQKIQLMEVFGIDSAKFVEIQSQVRIDETKVKKIAINSVSFEALRNHPYLRYKEANAIIQYRKQHGNYGNIADLNKVVLLSAETIDKLLPYLSFDL